MTTQQLNRNSRLPALLARVADPPVAPLMLLDVGVSGGIEDHWQVFGSQLHAVGFDPLVAEIRRLQAENPNPNVRFVEGFVSCSDYDARFPPDLRNDRIRSKDNSSYLRSSSLRAQQVMRMDYAKEVFNQGEEFVLSEHTFELDAYVRDEGISNVDFVKVDTDGHDFPVLLGAEEVLRTRGVLGLSVEVQLHGASHDAANVFSNIDRFLRDLGFTLFDLDVYRYTRADLPGIFQYDIPAQTRTGQVQWGEAVYFRDLADVDLARSFSFEISVDKVLKLACLLDLFGMPDSVAELLRIHSALVEPRIGPIAPWLDALMPTEESFAAYNERFDKDPKTFFAGRQQDVPLPRRLARCWRRLVTAAR